MTEDAITVEEMRSIDINSEYLGISRLMLMENAGAETARAIMRKINVKDKNICIIAHLGNKGGDGFVAARHLANQGAHVNVVLIGKPAQIRTMEARKNWEILSRMEYSINKTIFTDTSQLPLLEKLMLKADIIIDALLGTGIKGKIRTPIAEIVELINKARENGRYIVSIDLPTGINPNTGKVMGNAVKAHLTITHHKPKIGLIKEEARKYIGELIVANIGIPLEAELFTGPGDVLISIKERKPISHKGDYGRIVIVGGSKDYSGAPALAALAALKTGADLAIIIAPKTVSQAIRSFSPNLIVREYEGEFFNENGLKVALNEIKKADSIIIGPGLSLTEETVKNTLTLIEELKRLDKKVTIDADAIKICSKKKDVLKGLNGVITPHTGEFKILTGINLPSEENKGWIDRIKIIKEQAKKLKITILLKAHYDIISDGERVKINRTGNPGMTVGGTGDVLAGITSTFLAWENTPFRAATAAAFINGLAGDLAVNEKGFHITATDVLDKIPDAFKEVTKYT